MNVITPFRDCVLYLNVSLSEICEKLTPFRHCVM